MVNHQILNFPAHVDKVLRQQIAVAALLFFVGCNKYHTPVTIDPPSELRLSSEDIPVGDTILKIPAGWTIHSVDRRWDGRPFKIDLERSDQRGRVGVLIFDVSEKPLVRSGGAIEEKVSRDCYDSVFYRVLETTEPSGDDTPGAFRLRAYVKVDDDFWEMSACFLVPVRPSLVQAVRYIDAILPERAQGTEKRRECEKAKRDARPGPNAP